MDHPIIFSLPIHAHLLPSLINLHSRCITEPTHTIATFLPPIDIPLMTSWWNDRIAEVEKGERVIIMQMSGKDINEEVAACVMLEMPFGQTGPFRGTVQKLLVLPEFRKRGIAGRMMGVLEDCARREGRTLLMLDTEKGSPAEDVYPRMGYIKVGEIPAFEISPLDGSLKTAVFFYKDMR